jgi:phosphoribosylanthranilate isomerase
VKICCIKSVAEAIRTVRPTGVDLCNGVRRAGKLDAGQLAAFFDAAYAAETETEK